MGIGSLGESLLSALHSTTLTSLDWMLTQNVLGRTYAPILAQLKIQEEARPQKLQSFGGGKSGKNKAAGET